jgi:hypothetical protein
MRKFSMYLAILLEIMPAEAVCHEEYSIEVVVINGRAIITQMPTTLYWKFFSLGC